MATRDEMLRAILANRESDDLRLAYAVWLVDDCEPAEPELSEFIRVQCELASLFSGPCRGCGRRLDDDRIADGCPCNSPRGVNHGLVPAYVCTCPGCDPRETGGARDRPEHVEQLRRRERELFTDRNAMEWSRSIGLGYVEAAAGSAKTSCVYGNHPINHGWQSAGVLFRRGFVDEVRCSAADWLEHHEGLYWHPEQKVPCPTCEARGEWQNTQMRYYGGFLCTRCGTHQPPGTVPRPFPGGPVQPITAVRLTTWPGETVGWTMPPIASEVGEPVFRYAEWPGVVFRMPGA